MSDTEYYTMEAARRPHAARRSTNLNPAPARTVPTMVASVPVAETAYFAMERVRGASLGQVQSRLPHSCFLSHC